MTDDLSADYLAGLPTAQREELARVNGAGWAALIRELVDAAADGLGEHGAATCRVLAKESPEEVVEIVRRSLGAAAYNNVLREVLRVRTDPESGRSWTPVQELVCRCPFQAVVT